jgi:hypothetical protein
MTNVPVADELRLMVAPAATYRRLLAEPLRSGWRAVLLRPAFVALVIGAFVTLTNSGQLYPTLLLGTALAWAWVPALQLLVATPLIALGRRRPLPLSSALDLFFLGHAPWSLWLLIAGASMMGDLPEALSTLRLGPLLLSALLPIAWTTVLIWAFGRTVLGLPAWLALLGTLAYEALIWGAAYLYVGAVTFRFQPFSKYAGFLG